MTNIITNSTYKIIDVGGYKIIKGVTITGLGQVVGYAGIVVSGIDIAKKGFNWSNSTDAVMGGISAIPGGGWVIGGIYFISNEIIKETTGKDIGEHAGDTANSIKQTYNGIVNWLSRISVTGWSR